MRLYVKGSNETRFFARVVEDGRDKTHCPQGHPYSGGNLGVGRRSSGATFRFCKTCNRAASRVV